MKQSQSQTSFSVQEPLNEAPRLTVEQEKKQAELAKLPWFKKRKNIILLVTGLIVFLISTVALMPSKVKEVAQPTPTPSATPQVVNESGLKGRINALKQELEEAETNQQALPFPAVDMEINL